MQAVQAMAERDLRLWPPAPSAPSPAPSGWPLPASRDQTRGGPGGALEPPSPRLPDVAKSGNGHDMQGEAGDDAVTCGAVDVTGGRWAGPDACGGRLAADRTDGGAEPRQQNGQQIGSQSVCLVGDLSREQGLEQSQVQVPGEAAHPVKKPRLGGTSDVGRVEAGPWGVPDGACSSCSEGPGRASLPETAGHGCGGDSWINGMPHTGPGCPSEDGEHGEKEQGANLGSTSADVLSSTIADVSCGTAGSHLPK